ncbi:MAG: phosphoglucosamine mutase [Lentimicrobium sp.]|jgi:phosphomannomutase|nr:phosphoglucosamine mutase [Lentimicrobium sp.]
MTLIRSISGIRGTIGGRPGDGLSPLDVVKYTAAYATLIGKPINNTLVIGRDARVSGEMVSHLVAATLCGMGFNVIDLGLSTTPTVELAVTGLKAAGGIILTASHNPWQWNALKLLNNKGEFLDQEAGNKILEIAEKESFIFCEVDKIGKITRDDTWIQKHIDLVLQLPYIDVAAIKNARFRVAIDAVNSTGGIAIPMLLRALGVETVLELYCKPNGIFPHNPEPLPEHLVDISNLMKKEKADVGFVVDPDVDRLAIICEDGSMFGEEYTLVAVADYLLGLKKGNTVSNLSSTRALRDITEKAGGTYHSAAVGEVNVVAKMKETNAVIGGEGNGGVILPDLHYGRDALVGIALFLSQLALTGHSCTSLRKTFPEYYISKNKIQLSASMDVDQILIEVAQKYKEQPINTIDGVKIEFGKEWVHLRKSNTEPIIRIYAESSSSEQANGVALKIMEDIKIIAGLD